MYWYPPLGLYTVVARREEERLIKANVVDLLFLSQELSYVGTRMEKEEKDGREREPQRSESTINVHPNTPGVTVITGMAIAPRKTIRPSLLGLGP